MCSIFPILLYVVVTLYLYSKGGTCSMKPFLTMLVIISMPGSTSGLDLFFSFLVFCPIFLLSVCRCLWSVGCGACGGSSGEIPVCFRGVREEPVPQPAQQVWEAAAPLAVPPHRLFFCHRAAFLRATGGENTHRNSDKGHAADREQLQLALHAYSIEGTGHGAASKVKKKSHTSNRVMSVRRKISVSSEQGKNTASAMR